MQIEFTMKQRHKDIIRENYLKLTDALKDDVEHVCAHLYQSRIISQRMMEDILEGRTTSRERAKALLDLIVKRGPCAFDALYLGTLEAELFVAADILQPDKAPHQNLALSDPSRRSEIAGGELSLQENSHLEQQNRERESMEADAADSQGSLPEDFPESWPSEEHIRMTDSPVKHVSPNSQMYKDYFDSLKPLGQTFYYTMQHKQRGKMLIINNEEFTAKDEKRTTTGLKFLSNRIGSSLDRDSLSSVFKQLGFDVEFHDNLKAKDMEAVFESECKQDHKNYDCFALAILSHGYEDHIYGSDGYCIKSEGKLEHREYVKVKDIKDKFCRVPSLAGKPKLFFIQACRGSLKDPGIKTSAKDGATAQTSEASDKDIDIISEVKEVLANLENTVMSDGPMNTIPTDVDYFMAMSTVPGKVSYRDTVLGTWFIQAVVYIFRKYAHEKDLNILMTWVNSLVTKGETELGMKQAAEKTDTFRKTFCFFPGLDASMPPPS